MIFEAADARQLAKAKDLAPNMADLNDSQKEWLLFSKIFRSLGYSNFSDGFESLAESLPYQKLQPWLVESEPREKIIAHWAGELGLIPAESKGLHENFLPTWEALRRLRPLDSMNSIPMAPTGRPQNHPLRRLAGMYHHLARTGSEGLVKSWLRALWEVEALLQAKAGNKRVFEPLARLFDPVGTEVLSQLLTPTSKKTAAKPLALIGQSRQRVVIANAVIPFFLSWAREAGDRGLEKTLFALFLTLPGEGGNHKTELMEERLFAGRPIKLRKSLSYYQGLIQLYDDWCRQYDRTCEGCGLGRLIIGAGNHGARSLVGK